VSPNKAPLRLPLLLALLVLIGLIGMLIVESSLDRFFFALAAAPLVIGFIYWMLAQRRRRTP